MSDVTVCSWNVRGLNFKFKRASIFEALKHSKPHILCLQETHLMRSKVMALKKHWVANQYHSTYSNYAGGVAILIRKGLPFVCHQVVLDPKGQYVILHVSIHSTPLILVAVYLPPPVRATMFSDLNIQFANLPNCPMLILGDFNSVLQPDLDRLKPLKSESGLFRAWCNTYGYVDLWRWKFPEAKVYSCQSRSYAALSRIDFALATKDFLPVVRSIAYLSQTESDHSLIQVGLTMGHRPTFRTWRLSPLWISTPEIAEGIPTDMTIYWSLNTDSAPVCPVWDAYKSVVRGSYISRIKGYRSAGKRTQDDLWKVLEEAHAHHMDAPSSETRGMLMEAHRALQLHLTDLTRKQQLYLSAHIHEHGGKNGRLLAYLAHADCQGATIAVIHLPDGSITSDALTINQTFVDFYATLYRGMEIPPETDFMGFFESLDLPALSASQQSLLDKPIMLEEVTKAISLLPSNKTPGLDGLPSEWYQAHAEVLAPRLLKLFQDSLKLGKLPESLNEALIVVIPKPGKDSKYCGSYRPISLLNGDVKILAKILALRLQSVILALIPPDQSGFMPGRSTFDNIRRLYLHVHEAARGRRSGLVLSLDILKAFDTVSWSFLWEAMAWMGIGPTFIHWVCLLYADPKARVCTNMDISAPFSLGRGTRQGCPLSPLLFAIAIEPLALALRQTAEIGGIRSGPLEEKISLYADDALVYLDGRESSFTKLMQVVEEFGAVSGLWVGWEKLQALAIGPPSPYDYLQRSCIQLTPSLKYLGIQIHADLPRYEELNVTPIVQQMTEKFRTWSSLPLNLFGRINIFKMIFLPKFLYSFRASLVFLTKKLFAKLDSALFTFIWNSCQPRIAKSSLQAAKPIGGLACPNLRNYFLASQLTYIHD